MENNDIQKNNGQDSMLPLEQNNNQEIIYTSPTLISLQINLNPSTICQHCPKSVWFQSNKTIKCFCQVMHSISYQIWQTQEEAIRSCDAQIVALQELVLNNN